MPGFDDLMKTWEKDAKEAKDKVNGTTTSKESNSKVSDLKIHNFFNWISGNRSVVIARGQNFRACQGLFFKLPIVDDVVAVVSKDEKKIDVPPQTYYSKDSQEIKIDWYIKYNVVDAAKMIKKTQEIGTTIQEDTEYLMSYYLKTKTAKEISEINKVTEADLETVCSGFLKTFEETYGVKISTINSNNITVPLIQSIAENEQKEASTRKIIEANRETERNIRTADASAALDIEKQKLSVDKERLEMYSSAINNSKAPDALARIMGGGQSMDVYHHDDSTPKIHR